MAVANDNTSSGSDKLNKIIAWVAAFSVSVIISVAGIMYTDMKTRTATLEERVSFLFQDKVSRAEFREEMTQIRIQNEANKADIIARQEAMKVDILSRLDLLMQIRNVERNVERK